MKTQFVGRNITIRDNLKEEIQKKLDRMNKYFHEDADATITLSTEGGSDRAEITVRMIGSQTILRADQRADEFLQAIDQCIDSLVSQIRKYKTKLQRRHQAAQSIRFENLDWEDEEEAEDDEPRIARVKTMELRPMSPEEACLQMELLGHDLFLFRDAETDEIQVVYRRKAGDYGLIIPE